MVKASDMIRLARTQLGVKDGDKKVLEYIHAWEPSWGANTPWCACFLTWLADECGLNTIRGASVPSMVRLAKEKGLWLAEGQQEDGDFVVYTYSSDNNPDHIGLDVGGGISIDGNYNDKVMEHVKSKTRILGYIKNKYEAEKVIKKVKVCYNGTDGLNIRLGASFQSQIDEVVGKNVELEVVADLGDMYMLKDFRYVSNDKQYVKDVKSSTTTKTLKKGDTVKVLNAINYDNGKPFVVWYDSYDVIEVKGKRIVIGKGNVVTSAIDKKYLKKI